MRRRRIRHNVEVIQLLPDMDAGTCAIHRNVLHSHQKNALHITPKGRGDTAGLIFHIVCSASARATSAGIAESLSTGDPQVNSRGIEASG